MFVDKKMNEKIGDNLKKTGESFVRNEKMCIFAVAKAQMAESVDALVSNTSGATHPGSIPGLGTKVEKTFRFSPLSFLSAF